MKTKTIRFPETKRIILNFWKESPSFENLFSTEITQRADIVIPFDPMHELRKISFRIWLKVKTDSFVTGVTNKILEALSKVTGLETDNDYQCRAPHKSEVFRSWSQKTPGGPCFQNLDKED